MKTLLNNKQFKGRINDHVKKNENILKIGQVIAIIPSVTNFLHNSQKFLINFFELKMAIAWSIFKILSSSFFANTPIKYPCRQCDHPETTKGDLVKQKGL